MEFSDFHLLIRSTLSAQDGQQSSPDSAALVAGFESLAENSLLDDAHKIHSATILFEGFYQSFQLGALKETLGAIRAKRWCEHYGTPTVPFLVTWKDHIAQTARYFESLSSPESASSSEMPWVTPKSDALVLDSVNQVLIDPVSLKRVVAPDSREKTGFFTKTHNPFGGFTTTPCDPVSQKFLAHAASVAQTGGRVLEIGAAFGAATLQAIANGATVFCNDIDAENLAVVRQRYLEESATEGNPVTGDSSKLVLVPGALPDELVGLPDKQFDAILICRVLHFFSGAKIEQSLALLARLLAPEGKIYIVCETPFLKNWQKFIPEFLSRVESGVEWPGEITDPATYESSGRAASLPQFVHWITREVLERSLVKAGFEVEHAEYINRKGQFPDDLLLPEYGQESVGAIGRV